MVHQLPMEGYRGLDTLDHKLVQGPFHLVDGFFPRLCRGNQLGDHRIVVGRYAIATVYVGIHTYAMTTWYMQGSNLARRRPKIVVRVLRIDPAFYGVQFWEIVLSRNRYPGRYQNLLTDQIVIDDLLRNGVLYLDTCIHLHKVEFTVFVHQKLHRTGPFVFDIFRCLYGRFSHFVTEFVRHKRRWGFLR